MSTPSRAGSFYLILIGLALALIGGIFVWLLGRSYLEARATRQWPTTEAMILQSGVEERKLGRDVATEYRQELLFGYVLQGKSYTGERFGRRENPWGKSRDVAQAEADRYPVGSRFPVHVNPENPSQAVLEHDTQAAGYSIWFPALFVVGGLGIVVATMGKLRRKNPVHRSENEATLPG